MVDVLEHYGAKGMKWGVRKERERLGAQNLNRYYDSVRPKLDTFTQPISTDDILEARINITPVE